MNSITGRKSAKLTKFYFVGVAQCQFIFLDGLMHFIHRNHFFTFLPTTEIKFIETKSLLIFPSWFQRFYVSTFAQNVWAARNQRKGGIPTEPSSQNCYMKSKPLSWRLESGFLPFPGILWQNITTVRKAETERCLVRKAWDKIRLETFAVSTKKQRKHGRGQTGRGGVLLKAKVKILVSFNEDDSTGT